MRVHGLIGLLLAALLAPAPTRAQTAPEATSETTNTALTLDLALGNSQLDGESVRKAIELELRRPVLIRGAAAAPGPSLSVAAHADRSVTVTYRASNGSSRARSIGIPQDPARAAEVIALLAGNVSRDEAAELLANLAAQGVRSEPPVAATEPVTTPNETRAEPNSPTEPVAGETRPSSSPRPARQSNPPPLLTTPFPAFNLSLFPPITLYRHSDRRIFAGEFGLGYSHVGELRGGGFNGFVLRTERDVKGLSFATFYNDAGGTVAGVAGSALVNRRLRLNGLALSGLLNLGAADGHGASVAGLANLEQDFEGFQAAGAANWAGTFQGLQAAGGLNRATTFSGVQAAGAVNIASSMSGLQLGVVNVASDVHGLQLGVVNVAKRVRGTSIGLVSVADNGRVQPVLWASSSLPSNAAMKFTVGPFYTQAGLGYAPGNRTYAYELGLGGHFAVGRFFLEPGVHYSELRSARHPFDHELIEYGHYRLAAGVDLGQVSPFGGGGVLQRFAHSADAPASSPLTVEVFGGAAFF